MSEYFVEEALDALPEEVQERALAEMAAFTKRLRSWLSPDLDVEFEVGREAFMRHIDDDETAPVWQAWKASRDLAAELDILVRGAGWL
ncbi:MAG: hypothetical protein QM733_18945 [Ilumatobacteraceae bacterium]